MSEAIDFTTVKVNLPDDTIKKIEKTKERLNLSTVTGALIVSVSLSDMLTSAIDKDAHVIVKEKNGKTYEIVFPTIDN